MSLRLRQFWEPEIGLEEGLARTSARTQRRSIGQSGYGRGDHDSRVGRNVCRGSRILREFLVGYDQAKYRLRDGLAKTVTWYEAQVHRLREVLVCFNRPKGVVHANFLKSWRIQTPMELHRRSLLAP